MWTLDNITSLPRHHIDIDRYYRLPSTQRLAMILEANMEPQAASRRRRGGSGNTAIPRLCWRQCRRPALVGLWLGTNTWSDGLRLGFGINPAAAAAGHGGNGRARCGGGRMGTLTNRVYTGAGTTQRLQPMLHTMAGDSGAPHIPPGRSRFAVGA